MFGGWAWCFDQISWSVILESFKLLMERCSTESRELHSVRWLKNDAWKSRLCSWLLGGSWQSAVSLRRGPMELYTFWKEMALTWRLLENDGKWMHMIFIVFVPSRKNTATNRDFCWIFVDHLDEFVTLRSFQKSFHRIWSGCFVCLHLFWLTVVRKSRPVGW